LENLRQQKSSEREHGQSHSSSQNTLPRLRVGNGFQNAHYESLMRRRQDAEIAEETRRYQKRRRIQKEISANILIRIVFEIEFHLFPEHF
jgi:hypothetical protein